MPSYRRSPPIPPRWLARERPFARPPLAQFVLLSMLLHALAIALFGAPSGGSREGRAMWGSLEVVLPGISPEPGPGLQRDRAPIAPREPPEASRPREAGPPIPPAPKETEPPQAAPEVPYVFPPVLDRIVTPEREPTPPLQLPAPTEVQVIPPPPPERTTAPEPPTVEVPVPAPLAPAIARPLEPTVELLPTPRVELAPAEAPPIPAPLAQPLPPLPLPAPSARAPVERELVETPTLSAMPAPVPSTPPVERPPVEVQAIPVPRLESIAPLPGESASRAVEMAPMPEIRAAPPWPQALERAPVIQERAPAARIEREVPARIEPPARSPAEGPSPRPSPKAGEATPYDPTKPGIDLDAVRRRAGQIAREGTGNRALLPFPMPPVPAKKSKLETAIENARKPDCRDAYKGLGLAAIVPLIANEFGEGSCRW